MGEMKRKMIPKILFCVFVMVEHKSFWGKLQIHSQGRNSHLIKFLSTVSLTLAVNEMLIRMNLLVQWKKNYLISTQPFISSVLLSPFARGHHAKVD